MIICAVIIDDERRSRETLAFLLQQYCPTVSIAGFADSLTTGIEAIDTHNPNLVFLDIEMPYGSGFDLLDSLLKRDFEVIFTTAYDQYALRAFKFSALDYLLKPIDRDELIEAVARAEERLTIRATEQQQRQNESLEVLLYNLSNRQSGNNRIALPTSDGIEFVQVQDIIRCEAERNYTYFYIVGRERLMITRTLKEFEVMLDEYRFFRTHNSHLVNLDHIVKYIKGEGGQVVMSDGSLVEISRRRREELLEKLGRA